MFSEKVILVDNVVKSAATMCTLLDLCIISVSALRGKKSNAKLRLLRNGKLLYAVIWSQCCSPLLLIQRNSCTPPVLAALSTMSVLRVFVQAQYEVDFQALQKNVLDKDLQVQLLDSFVENNVHEYITLELLSEKLIVHVVKAGVSSTSFNLCDEDRKAEEVHEAAEFDLRRSRTMSSSDVGDDEQTLEILRQCRGVVATIIQSFGEKSVAKKVPRKLVIPTLDCSILSAGKFRPFDPSPLKPIPFETDIFKGIAFFTHKHETVDPRFAPFYPKTRKVTYEVQVQGKFKRLPEGEIYCGAETMEKMEMGFMTRAMSNAALKFAAVTVDDLHYSFGETQSNPDFEFPHLVGPLFPTLDKVLETKDGDPLPVLGVPFVEDPAYRKKRLKWVSIKDANVSLSTTYSFSVNTQNIDVVSWQFVNIPMCKPMDLRDFFGGSPLRLIAYEVPYSVVKTFKTHPQRYSNYVFNICLTRVTPGMTLLQDDAEPSDTGVESETAPEFVSDEESISPDNKLEMEAFAKSSLDETSKIYSDEEIFPEETDAEDDENPAYEEEEEAVLKSTIIDEDIGSAEEEDTNDVIEDVPLVKYRDAGVSSPGKLHRKQYIASTDRSGTAGVRPGYVKNLLAGISSALSIPAMIDIPETSGDYQLPSHESETLISHRYCPAIVEAFDSKKKTTNFMYLLPFEEQGRASLAPRLRTFDEIARKVNMVPIPKLHKNKLLVSVEKKRRQIVESYRISLASTSSRVRDNLYQLLGKASEADQQFLTHSTRPATRETGTLWDGSIALALGNRHWIEYRMVIKNEGIGISLHESTKEMWIPLQSMIRAKELKPEEAPFAGFSFLFIETLRKIYYLVVRDSQTSHTLLNTLRGLGVTEERTIDKSTSVGLDDIFPQLIFKSRMEIWKLERKRLFNCRRLIFTSFGVSHPCEVAESCLSKVLKLAEIWTHRTDSLSTMDSKCELIMLWINFLDELSYLQVLDVHKLSETERAVFFLNIYHTMVIHCSLVLFPPQTRSSWEPFFHDVAYLLAFDVMTIAELEHNIIRACMTRPPRSALGLGRTRATPKTIFPSFALKRRDFRFNFCLNNGSISMPSVVCIYKAETLDLQLDEMTALAVSVMLSVDVEKRLVHLPVTCSWFASDFVSSGSIASPTDCLRIISMYCNPAIREKLDRLLLSGTSPIIKYKPITFKSRIICPTKG